MIDDEDRLPGDLPPIPPAMPIPKLPQQEMADVGGRRMVRGFGITALVAGSVSAVTATAVVLALAAWSGHASKEGRYHGRGAGHAASPTTTAGTAALTLDQANTALARATNGQARAFAVFPAGAGGFTGALVGNANQSAPGADNRIVVWIDSSGDVLVGSLVTPTGVNLTQEAIKAFAQRGVHVMTASGAGGGPAAPAAPAAPNAPPTTLSAIDDGDVSGRIPVLTVFIDPNCVYCNVLWKTLRSPALDGKIAIRWVPVGIVRPDSVERAATVLAGGVKALDEDEQKFNGMKETGGAAKSTDQVEIAKVRANTQEFIAWSRAAGIGVGTPTLAWKTKSGAWQAVSGSQPAYYIANALGVK